jgi:hypothetical protein
MNYLFGRSSSSISAMLRQNERVVHTSALSVGVLVVDKLQSRGRKYAKVYRWSSSSGSQVHADWLSAALARHDGTKRHGDENNNVCCMGMALAVACLLL